MDAIHAQLVLQGKPSATMVAKLLGFYVEHMALGCVVRLLPAHRYVHLASGRSHGGGLRHCDQRPLPFLEHPVGHAQMAHPLAA